MAGPRLKGFDMQKTLTAVTVIGIIGAGEIGAQIARAAITHGYKVASPTRAGPRP
jgi:phosphoglycerate dehydrogenase-like enzyme